MSNQKSHIQMMLTETGFADTEYYREKNSFLNPYCKNCSSSGGVLAPKMYSLRSKLQTLKKAKNVYR